MLTLDNLTKRYKSGRQEVYALKNVSLSAEKGGYRKSRRSIRLGNTDQIS